MPAKPPPIGLEEIQHLETAKLFGRAVWVRLLIAPVVGLMVIGIALFETAPWRRWLAVPGVLIVVALSVMEVRRYRRRGLSPNAIPLNLGLGVCGQMSASAASGGLESPVLPVALLIAVVSGVVVRSSRVAWSFFAVQVAGVWSFAVVGVFGLVSTFNMDLLGGGARGGLPDATLWTMAAFYTVALTLASTLGRALRSYFDAMLVRALEAREDALREHGERQRELIGLSGEIAHELKNPLASIKGLAALLARDAAEGKAAERLSVLRHEVDRMQGILEEFLNFSRPLVPLALEEAELRALAEEVAALHEGLGRERKVGLEVAGEPVRVRCDPRKVKQVLVNLVQNALDASAAGGEVRLAVRSEGERAFVEVLDRGAGLDPTVRERAFEPGVTTKARGSGLGLTIARAIARQHGGELELRGRDGGGCSALLELPVVAVAAPEAPETLEGAGT